MKKHTTILVPNKGAVYTTTGLCMANSFIGIVKDAQDALWVEIDEDCIKESHLLIVGATTRSPMQAILTILRRGWNTITHVQYTTTDYAKAAIKYQVTEDGPFRKHRYYMAAKDVIWYHMERWVPMIKEGVTQ